MVESCYLVVGGLGPRGYVRNGVAVGVLFLFDVAVIIADDNANPPDGHHWPC